MEGRGAWIRRGWDSSDADVLAAYESSWPTDSVETSAKQRLDFESPTKVPSSNSRGHRSSTARKAKRKRYREKKRILNRLKMNTSAQESLFQQNLCSRWRERRETYELHQDDQDDVHSLFNETDVPKNPTEGMFEDEHLEQVEHQYSTISQESLSSTSMPLLLPAVLVPIEDKESFSYAPSVLSSMEQQCIIKQAKDDRDQALMEAKQYRDLAEQIQREKREIEHKLVSSIEVVRDFWRNKIVEGNSRAGRVLRASLLQKH